MQFSKNTIIAIVLAVIVLAAAGYMFFGKPNTQTGITADSSTKSAAELTFINLTAEIQPVKFDTSILFDPRFRALEDLHTAIIPETAGRKDPFAPLPGLSTK
ncbi:MAG: hypothetical protein ABA06_03650 [Parcubacteria bacterium C7867-001]|nr:MAG: hypothetical protein ABA06_03650 [Parcubacteria bacterium C7867-001]